jgi:TolB-like protein/Tfp pilus assembly protein PilF
VSLISELRERKVVRMAIIYAVAGWGVLQIADIAAGVLGLPDWTLRFTLAVLVLCFPLALVLSWFFKITPEGLRRETAPPTARPSVAVLPFRRRHGHDGRSGRDGDDGDDGEDDDYLADGLTEETLNALAGIPDLRVPSRRSCFRCRDSGMGPADAAAELGVDYVVDGTLARTPDGFSISVELVDAGSDTVLWSRTWRHRGETVPEIHHEIARQVASALGVRASRDPLSGRATSPRAYDAWLRGRHATHRNTADGFREAVSCFEEAIELDEGFAPARAGLSRAYSWLARYGLMTPREGFRRARDAAERALELDPQLAEAHVALAEIQLSDERDFAGTETSLRRALDLQPGNADTHAHLGHFLAMLGRLDEAIAVRQRSVELDPLSEQAHIGLADTLFLAGRHAEACHELNRIRELAPGFPVAHLEARIALAEDRPADALRIIEEEPLEWRRLYIGAIALHRLGETAAARARLEELTRRYGDEIALQAAIVHAQFGEPDAAFRWLDTAIEQRDPGLIELRADPELQPLRSDPRYEHVLHGAGFL